jgi:DNA polymerase-3 subunit alpha (Gram-positive type)
MENDIKLQKLISNLELTNFELGSSELLDFKEKIENDQVTWYFSFYIDPKIVSEEIKENFHKELHDQLEKFKIKLDATYRIHAKLLIDDSKTHMFWPTIRQLLIEKAPNLANLPTTIMVDNGVIEFSVNSNTESDQIEYFTPFIKKFCSQNNILVRDVIANVDEKIIDIDQIKQKSATIIHSQPRAFKAQQQSNVDVSEAVYLNNIKKPGNYTIQAMIFDKEIREIKTKDNRQFTIGIFKVTDFTSSIQVKKFLNPQLKEAFQNINENDWVAFQGKVSNDAFAKELVFEPNNFTRIKKQIIKSEPNDLQRYELHAHSKMSSLEGISKIKEYYSSFESLGIKGIAFTDTHNVQIYPEVESFAKNNSDVKTIYGLEMSYVRTPKPILHSSQDQKTDYDFIIFDLETTGFSNRFDAIIEFAAIHTKTGEKFTMFANPGFPIPKFISNLTNITDDMLINAPSESEALEDFLNFINKFENPCMVAHNADFDMNFLINKSIHHKLNMPDLPYLDTLELSRNLFPGVKRHGLAALVKKYKVKLDSHHRAIDDTLALQEVFNNLIKDLPMHINQVNILVNNEKYNTDLNYQFERSKKVSLLVKESKGLRNIFKIVSHGLTDRFFSGPKPHLQDIKENSNGLLIGSNFEEGEFFDLLLNHSYEAALTFAKNLDYIEIMPIEQLMYLIDNNTIRAYYILEQVYHDIHKISDQLGLPLVGSSRPYHVYDYQKLNRKIYTDSISAIHRYRSASLTLEQYPNNALLTPTEMLASFKRVFNAEEAAKIVFTGPEKIVDQIENIKIIKDELFAPNVEDVMEIDEQDIRKIAYEKAQEIYSNNLPEIVKARLDRELESIIKHRFDVVYLISMKLVKKSLSDGYLVGSRGSVGSSFAATMLEITEVNPLPPHYVCPICKNSEFVTNGVYSVGYDMPDKKCICGNQYKKDGHDIPFETFLGFKGDKVPDIDLNFSGEYQAQAHNFVREIFGDDHAFRAGTISSVADKTAFGYVKGFEKDSDLELSPTQIDFLVKDLTGTKKTTGQHPGGIIVVPKDMQIYDITPIQYPADDRNASWRTTHFDFHAIHDNLLKLDILGHDDPTIIRFLQDQTNFDIDTIDFSDSKVLAIFNSIDSLELLDNPLKWSVGSLAIPEFGTSFVREMLREVNAKKFSDLVQISGLSHGTDVWIGNAQKLIKDKTATISDVIGCRDDIMVKLMQYDLEPSLAFSIMEDVRKGKGLTPDYIKELKQKGLPDWYISSCQKIKYMFPKAHATAYVTMAFRIAYFKVYMPLAFYAAFFSVKADQFHLNSMMSGTKAILSQIELIKDNPKPMPKDSATLLTLEVSLEMTLRGYKFNSIDLNVSQAEYFVMDETNNSLYPSFKTIDGLGASAAQSIIDARNEKQFSSIEDFKKRTKVNTKVFQIMTGMDVFKNLPEKED